MKKLLERLNPFSKYVPKLKVTGTVANSIDEAIKKIGGKPAGQRDFEWVLENPKEARKVLIENNVGYFFPGTLYKGHIPYLFWDKGKFLTSSEEKKYEWNHRFSRIVLLD